MFTVYLVDGKTHVHLPPSEWGKAVLSKMRELGHTVQEANIKWTHAPRRCCKELEEVDRLFEETGL